VYVKGACGNREKYPGWVNAARYGQKVTWLNRFPEDYKAEGGGIKARKSRGLKEGKLMFSYYFSAPPELTNFGSGAEKGSGLS